MSFRNKFHEPSLPLVTIGVSSYNYSMYIEAALNSLLAQTYKNIELIIIDDCSEDDCPQKIEKWISENHITCQYIHHKKNVGITKTSNELIKLAKGKYISLFATDDIMLPEKIERQVDLLEAAGQDYGMCYANVETINENNELKGFYNDAANVGFEGDVLEKFVFGDLKFATPSSLIRSSVYKKTGLYDERVLFEDYNFWLRVFSCFKAKYCDYPCLIYRVKNQSPILDQWMKNDRERFHHDRIISNFQVLAFTKNKEVKSYLREKNMQYLKSLYASNSGYFKELFFYLFFNGYFQLPYKLFFKRIINPVR